MRPRDEAPVGTGRLQTRFAVQDEAPQRDDDGQELFVGHPVASRPLARVTSPKAVFPSTKPKLVHAVVKTLRRKLGEDGSRAALILTERGLGYRMPAP